MTIPIETLEQVEKQLSTLDDEGAAALMAEFQREQPTILEWVHGWVMDESTGGDMMMLAMILWKAFAKHQTLSLVPKQYLTTLSNRIELPEEAFSLSQSDIIALTIKAWELANESVARYVVETLNCDDDGEGYSEDDKLQLLYALTTVAKGLEQAGSSTASEQPSSPPGVAEGWVEMERRLYAEVRQVTAEFADSHGDETMGAFILDCNAHYGDVLPGFDTQAGAHKHAGDYAYAQISEISCAPPKGSPAALLPSRERTAQFMDAVCRVLIRLEKDGAFDAIKRAAGFAAFVADHDEPLERSHQRLSEVRTHGVSAPPAHSGLAADTAALEANMARAEVDEDEAREDRAIAHVVDLARKGEKDSILPYLKQALPEDADDEDRLDHHLDRAADALAEEGNRDATRIIIALRYQLSDDDEDEEEWIDSAMQFLFD